MTEGKANPLRVLVVDDSTFMRHAITRIIESDETLSVAGTASDGLEAVKQTVALRPDVVTMDVEMPNMDGISALREIMRVLPTPVVMVSTLTGEGAEATLRALDAGAVDYVLKPGPTSQEIPQLATTLAAVLKRAARARPRKGPTHPAGTHETPKRTPAGAPARRIVVVGASTGGPSALTEVVPRLPAQLGAAVLVVQHMPAGFTEALARRLDRSSPLPVAVAHDGSVALTDQVLVAPGDRHLTVTNRGTVELTDDAPMHGVRPAIDVTLRSVAAVYGRHTTVAILTGMGRDGADGAAAVAAKGGQVITQDEETSVIFGMPAEARKAVPEAMVAPIGDIAARIVDVVQKVAV